MWEFDTPKELVRRPDYLSKIYNASFVAFTTYKRRVFSQPGIFTVWLELLISQHLLMVAMLCLSSSLATVELSWLSSKYFTLLCAACRISLLLWAKIYQRKKVALSWRNIFCIAVLEILLGMLSSKQSSREDHQEKEEFVAGDDQLTTSSAEQPHDHSASYSMQQHSNPTLYEPTVLNNGYRQRREPPQPAPQLQHLAEVASRLAPAALPHDRPQFPEMHSSRSSQEFAPAYRYAPPVIPTNVHPIPPHHPLVIPAAIPRIRSQPPPAPLPSIQQMMNRPGSMHVERMPNSPEIGMPVLPPLKSSTPLSTSVQVPSPPSSLASFTTPHLKASGKGAIGELTVAARAARSSLMNTPTNEEGSIDSQERFKCEIPGCERSYATRNNLRRHCREKHEVGKKYDCDWIFANGRKCTSSFGEAGKLRDHLERVHKGIRDYECTYPVNGKPCGKEFKQKCDWKRHVQAVHEGKRYACTLCGKKCSRRQPLSQHRCPKGSDWTIIMVDRLGEVCES